MNFSDTTVVAVGAVLLSLYNAYLGAKNAEAIREVARALVAHSERVKAEEAERKRSGPQEFP